MKWLTKPAAYSVALWLIVAWMPTTARAVDVYQQPEDFLAETFGDDLPEPAVVWVTKDVRARVKAIMGHDLPALRIRYWGRDGRTAWVLEEIGKTEPITTGYVVADGRVERVKVLIYRESRGWEVRYPFFTDQFKGTSLADDGRLDRDIDGISGATLSVDALTRLAALALFLHAQTPHGAG
ncbi:MAG: FMN-binding protein [Rhodospirillaceae bacterium]|jgi:hypothetical protein|nr:FMN-binding protein [Rhodospirillaceae bacterium]